MSHLEELFEQARNDPDTHVSKESIESWLNTLGENADQYHYLIELNKIIEIKFREKAKDISFKTQELLKKIYKKNKNEK